jgi:hypothetical protein
MQKNMFRTALAFVLVLMILATNAVQVSASDNLARKTPTPIGPSPTPGAPPIGNIIPMPVSITSSGGSFSLTNTADI